MSWLRIGYCLAVVALVLLTWVGGEVSHAQIHMSGTVSRVVAAENGRSSSVPKLPTQAQGGESQAQAQAQAKMGDFLFNSGDYTNAARYYFQAARQGHADAQVSLATCYAKGLGVPQNVELAKKWALMALNEPSNPDASSPKPVSSPAQQAPASRSDFVGTEAADSRHAQSAGNSASAGGISPEILAGSGSGPIGFGRVLTLDHQPPRLREPATLPASYFGEQ